MASSHYSKLAPLLISLVATSSVMPGLIADAQMFRPISSLLGLLRVDGILYCTPDGNANGTATPIFPNASIQLQCGGAVISTSITSPEGAFSIMLDPLQILFSNLLSSCRLTVATPLSTCNASLPSAGFLISALQSIGSTIVGLLNVIQLAPAGFHLTSSTN